MQYNKPDPMYATQAPDTQERQLPIISGRLRNVRNGLSEVLDRLTSASERLTGSMPRAVSTEKQSAIKGSGGYIGELTEIVGDCESILADIHVKLNDLERSV